jgi:PPE-repeat protein
MRASAAQAEQTATQARAAAAAYETAFAAVVPPPLIAANRALLMTLIATNVLGQNTPAIAATEIHYAEMWAQDAAAMYSYAGSSAAASQLTPYTEPPQSTSAAGLPAQSSAVAQAVSTSSGTDATSTLSQLVTALPQTLQSMALPAVATVATTPSSSLASSLSTITSFATGPISPFSYFSVSGVPYLLGIQSYLLPRAGLNLGAAASKAMAAPAASSALHASELGSGIQGFSGAGSVSADLGRAGLAGKLSVPPNWTTAAPAIRSAAFSLPGGSLEVARAVTADASGNLFNQVGLSSLAGRALTDTGGGCARSFSVAGSGAPGEATTATIFVIPAEE